MSQISLLNFPLKTECKSPQAYRANEDIRHWTSSTTAAFAHTAGIRKAKNKHDWLRPVARLWQGYFSFLNLYKKLLYLPKKLCPQMNKEKKEAKWQQRESAQMLLLVKTIYLMIWIFESSNQSSHNSKKSNVSHLNFYCKLYNHCMATLFFSINRMI